MEGRKHERVNREELYMFQVEHGRHFQLDQPVGSEMLQQPLEQLRYGTLTTVFDMCEVGKLNCKGEPIQKRTVILMTSDDLPNFARSVRLQILLQRTFT